MPYIHTRANVSISKEKEAVIKRRFGEAISILGKSENWLMLGFEEECRLYFRGSAEEPAAFLEVKLFGSARAVAYDKMTERLTQIVSEELAIMPDHIYIKYEEVTYWGWNGSNF